MNKHKISVVVPVYNVEDYILDCIESLVNQACDDFEVIFVDDCGKDNSVSIIKQNLHRLKEASIYTRASNGGLSAARNSGIRASTGDYVLFVDSDDYLTNNAISLFYESINKRDFDVVVSSYTKIPGNKCCHNSVNGIVWGNKKIRNAYYSNRIIVPAWNKLIKKEFLLTNNLLFKEGIIHEDVLWSFMIMTTAESLYSIENTTYVYRVRENSIMTRGYGMKNISSLIAILYEIKKWIDKDNRIIAKYYNKKLLEFSLTIYQRAKKDDFSLYYRMVQHNNSLVFYPSLSFMINYLLLKSHSFISNSIIAFLLKTKFKYLCR